MKHSGVCATSDSKKSGPSFQLFALFGNPLSHTLSPRMQEAGFGAIGLKAFYVPLEVERDEFASILKQRKKLLLDGFNVTVPYKQDALRGLDGLLPEARTIGAVNTVFRKGNRWIGTNTDAHGFITSLQEELKFRPRGKRAVMIGAGGAAHAVSYALCKAGVRSLCIVNEFPEAAQKLADHSRHHFKKIKFEVLALRGCDFKSLLARTDLVVQATSVGLKPEDPSLLPPEAIPNAKSRKIYFLDLVYKPAETAFLKAARAKGHPAINGSGMLLHQGVKAFEIWTGKKAPVAVMRRALMEGLAGKV